MVFGHADAVVHGGRLIHFIVEFHFLDNAFHQRARVGLIVDGKVCIIANALGLHSQNARKDGVESTHIDVTSLIFAHKLADTMFHLVGSLISKGERKNVPGQNAVF